MNDLYLCEWKTRYETEGQAMKAARKASAEKKEIIKQYHCDDCKGWHIGHFSLRSLRGRR